MRVKRTKNIEKVGDMCGENPYINKPTENIDQREFFVLENCEKTIACGYIRSFLKKIGTIGSLFVREGSRREGYGSFFVKKLEEKHRQDGVWVILTGVHKDNNVGLDFWRENGYRVAIESVNEPLARNPIDLGILERTSPVPLPDKRVSILAKFLREFELDNGDSVPREIDDILSVLEDSISSINLII